MFQFFSFCSTFSNVSALGISQTPQFETESDMSESVRSTFLGSAEENVLEENVQQQDLLSSDDEVMTRNKDFGSQILSDVRDPYDTMSLVLGKH